MITNVPFAADLSNQVARAFHHRRIGRRRVSDLHVLALLKTVAGRDHSQLTHAEIADLLCCCRATARRTVTRAIATGLLNVNRSTRLNEYAVNWDAVRTSGGAER